MEKLRTKLRRLVAVLAHDISSGVGTYTRRQPKQARKDVSEEDDYHGFAREGGEEQVVTLPTWWTGW